MKRWFLENLGLKALSLFIGVALWAYVGSQQYLQQTIRLPLEVRDVPAGMKVEADLKATVQVVFGGKKERIRELDREHEDFKAVVSLKAVQSANQELLVYPPVKVEPRPREVTVMVPNLPIRLLPMSSREKKGK